MNIKNQKGVTLTELVVYITVMLAVLGVMDSISSFFYNNLGIVKESAKYSAQFDSFNSYITVDIKNNKDVVVKNKTLIFEDGTTYVYNEADEGIYRGNQKIATNVKAFNVSKKTITINNVDKNILTVQIIIGNSSKTLFNRTIDYTLKYW